MLYVDPRLQSIVMWQVVVHIISHEMWHGKKVSAQYLEYHILTPKVL
jgi:hypothetical protein